MSVVSVVCCQVEICATDLSLVQRSPTDCGASFFVIKKPRMRGGYSPARGLQNTNPQWAVAPVEKKIYIYQNTRRHIQDSSYDCNDDNIRNNNNNSYSSFKHLLPTAATSAIRLSLYRGADKSLARPGRKQATATEDFDFHISYL